LLACTEPSECIVVFRGTGCRPSDPRAIAASQRNKLPPVRREVCGIGGPEYERENSQIQRRYDATCTKGRCVLVDRGQPREDDPF